MSAQVVRNAEFDDSNHDVHKKIHEEKIQQLYISPESLIWNLLRRVMMRSAGYTGNLGAFVVDEAHTVSK